MNTQTKEKLVSLVASGTDTYEQILRAIPELTEKDRKDPTARNRTGTARACRSERKRCLAMTNNAIAGTWDEWEKEHFTPEEIAESDLRVALIGELIRARQERGITQKQLEEMSGVTQPVIARLERGTTSPNISTLTKLLAPLGKKLAIVPM